jgi:hypothetical protein
MKKKLKTNDAEAKRINIRAIRNKERGKSGGKSSSRPVDS